MSLSDEDRQRIYEEEKARIEAHGRVMAEMAKARGIQLAAKAEAERRYKAQLVVVLMVIVLVPLFFFGLWHTFVYEPSPEQAAAPQTIDVDQQEKSVADDIDKFRVICSKENVLVQWPAGGDAVMYLHLPDGMDVTDYDARRLAQAGYNVLTTARERAGVSGADNCIVRVIDSTGKTLARSGAGGTDNG